MKSGIVDRSKLKAVIFDAYGTVARIGQRVNAYRPLVRAICQGERIGPAEVLNVIMTRADALEILTRRSHLPGRLLNDFQQGLAEEMESIQLFPDTPDTIGFLQEQGYKIGLCSNLAQPYAPPLLRLLPNLDSYIWSFEVGAVKPDPIMFQAACQTLGCDPEQGLMIGDSYRADIIGARRAGLQALWLQRQGQHGDIDSLSGLRSFFKESRSRR